MNFTYLAIGAMIAGAILLFFGSKQRTADGEWSSGLQWGYLLVMVGIFGILSAGFGWSFTAILLTFTLLTGVLWLWAKKSRKDKTIPDNNHFRDYMAGFFPIIAVVFVLRTFVAEPFQIPSSSMRPGLVKGDFILVNKFIYGIRIPVLNSVLIPTGKVERGDVAVFNYPVQPQVNYIKRIVGISGDVVEYKNKVLTVNGIVENDTLKGEYQYADDFNPQHSLSSQMYGSQFGEREFHVLKDEDAPAVHMPTLRQYLSREMPKYNYHDGSNDLKRYCDFAEDGSSFKCTVPEGKYFAMGDNRDNSADSRYWGFVNDNLIVGKAFFIWLNLGDMGRVGNSIR
ncbi:Signal peptidase I [Alysiella crassa]|uniref:Signal peptidase I n=2 Tax=Alysiella crassa TaxID=153491 RepID=A0A376BT64_9NEIS|nr:signal peptidase I [Alysiella crassa]SSY80041.1 Signal peptidase I [Alysiella crassa]